MVILMVMISQELDKCLLLKAFNEPEKTDLKYMNDFV